MDKNFEDITFEEWEAYYKKECKWNCTKECENCKDEIKLTNPIDKETYDDLSKYFKKKEEEKNESKYSY